MKENEMSMLTNNATYIDYLNRLRLLATRIITCENQVQVASYGTCRLLELSQIVLLKMMNLALWL